MPKPLRKFAEYLSSKRFYYLVLVFFFIEAAWIAFSAAYPQAFDESFHFGLIKVYSHYWLPFLSSQPPHADAFGAVPRDPSYLYHYLMSFPYRIISLITKEEIGQVVILRFINIALFMAGIELFRRVLRKAGTSQALTNLILALFALIPIVPQLAAQINYDNLLIPLTGAAILLSFRVVDEIRSRRVNVWSLGLLLGLCLLTSLVKYAFLPIFAGLAVFITVASYRAYKGKIREFFRGLYLSLKKQSRLAKAVLAVTLVLSLGMFIQRDGINLVRYHNIQPDCAAVLPVKDCLNYSPWAYSYKNHLKLMDLGSSVKYTNPVIYAFQWAYWMWYRLLFAVNGPGQNFTNYPPLPLPSVATLIVVVLGVIAVVKWWRKIFRGNIYLALIFTVSVSYIVALFAQGYVSYRYTGVLQNMNGRYLLPVLLLVAAVVGKSLSLLLRGSFKRKVALALVILLLFLEGGGVFTFITRSDPTWDMSNNKVVKANNTARKVLSKVIIKGKKSYGTPVWFFN